MARYVDIEKAITSMQSVLDEHPEDKDTVAYFAFEKIIEMLKNAPTADVVEAKRGAWLFKRPNGSYYCSCCGKGIKIKYGERTAVGWDFCPNCGAQMKGGAE